MDAQNGQSDRLEPDCAQIATFVNAIFKHAGDEGFVLLRSFYEGDEARTTARMSSADLKYGLPRLIAVAESEARYAARDPRPVVFCPPLAVFVNKDSAAEENLARGLVLTVECDAWPRAALQTLTALIGVPTVVVASGGQWLNPETDEPEPKLHLHWRLTAPTQDAAAHALLKEARMLAAQLVGGDRSGVPIVHPLRWPGSWHRKAVPRPAQIVSLSDNEIDLTEALALLRDAFGAIQRDGDYQNANHNPEADAIEVAAALAVIPNDDIDWFDWNRIGLATFGASDGSEEGFTAFDAWSAKSGKYNAMKTRKRWEHYYRSPPNRIGAGTLFYLAAQANPNWLREFDALLGAQVNEEAALDFIEFTHGEAETDDGPPPEVGPGQKDNPEPEPDEPQDDEPGLKEPKSEPEPKPEPKPSNPRALMTTSAAFVDSFTPPEFLVDDLLQRRFFYALTAPTGAGKTAVALLLTAHVIQGAPLGDREIEPGKVLYLAGENPDDVRMRWIKMAEERGFDPRTDKMLWITGTFSIERMRRTINAEAEVHGPFALIVIDTSAVYFEGADENSNTQLGEYARMQRKLVKLSGGPTVIALCHPVKNADPNNLLPRGGGAYVAETDGNLVLMMQSQLPRVVELHWHGKFRGADFAPIPFLIQAGTTERLKNSKGKPLWTVTAKHMTKAERVATEDIGQLRRDELLAEMQRQDDGRSFMELAEALDWSYPKGGPNKSLVQRVMTDLEGARLVKKIGARYHLTKAGKARLTGVHKPKVQMDDEPPM